MKDYIGIPEDKKKGYLESILSNSCITAKVLTYYALFILYKKDHKCVLHQNIQFFSDLITAVQDLFWYISPHHVKFALHGTSLPTFFKPLIGLNNPERYKNKQTFAPKTFLNLLELSQICWRNCLLLGSLSVPFGNNLTT